MVIFSSPHKFACSVASLAKILGTIESELIQHGGVTEFCEDDGTLEIKGNDESIYTFWPKNGKENLTSNIAYRLEQIFSGVVIYGKKKDNGGCKMRVETGWRAFGQSAR